MLPKEITGKKILLSPLDWGMGHTTRCVPLIRTLLANSNKIIFAGNHQQIDFIKREFPALETVLLAGYNVSLNSQKSSYLQLLLQFQKIRKSIRNEQNLANKICASEHIDIVISDNRYGFRSKHTTNILLTHQLQLQLPWGKKIINKRIKKWIEKFDECWIPDTDNAPLCGELVHAQLTIPKIFIGHLSRFSIVEMPKKFDYLYIASGPEPERSRFASLVCRHLKNNKVSYGVVGFRDQNYPVESFDGPTTAELEILINSAGKIISRAGYTTIMELMALNKKAILIPTPGQYEQLYLARTITAQNLTFIDEKRFFNDELIAN